MAVRVLIERDIEPGQEVNFHKLLMQLRGRAMQAKGYISGETLRSMESPNKFLVISTWNSAEDWQAWQSHPERRKSEEELSRFLRSPEKHSVYVYL